ncbi:hypothetical protein O3P69_011380 [Scylla paramamosain]|uniref:Uncharacterized protein n=1 Tax=Scylla paramamosain TaxID=85552 RepID=A0AAW0T6C2_SCYPA
MRLFTSCDPGWKMFCRSKNHVVKELFSENINGRYPGQAKQACKSLFAWSFKCYQEDKCGAIACDSDENQEPQALTEPPIYACKFGEGPNCGHILVIANEDGQIGLRDTRRIGDVAPVEGHQIHLNAILDVCWVPGSAELVSVSGDLRAILLTVEEDGSLTTSHTFLGHTRSIKTVSVNRRDPCMIATGARDGNIIIWDRRCRPHHRADEIAPAHHNLIPKNGVSPSLRKSASFMSVTSNSVTSVLFQQQHILISSGSSDGLIKLWDLRKTHGGSRREPQCHSLLEHTGSSSHRGFTSLSLSPQEDIIYASCMDNTIYAYHLAKPTPKPVAEYVGHQSLTYFVKSCISPCGSYLLSGSSDNCAYIWLTDQPGEPIAKLSGHCAEVTAVDWCPVDDDKLVTCADDMKLRIFRRKNTDLDDFDEKLKIHGLSERYVGKYDKEGVVGREESPKTRERKSSGSLGTLPPHPVTPSTSGFRHSYNFTPSEAPGSSTSPQTCPQTPQQFTPQQWQGMRGRATPCTPKTSERNMLLQWLVGARTPRSIESPSTGDSDSKKNTHKRKLTDLMGEDQENISDKEKPKSPNKKNNILCPLPIMNNQTSPSRGAAKMLKYGDDSEAAFSNKSQNEISADMADSVKPLDASDKLMSGFRKTVTNVSFSVTDNSAVAGKSSEQTTQTEKKTDQNCSSKQFGKFSSPTANLPNFIIDGTSPHSRPEVRIEKRRSTNWLTSISHQRKLKFSGTPAKVAKNGAASKSFSSHKKSVKKTLKIKSK